MCIKKMFDDYLGPGFCLFGNGMGKDTRVRGGATVQGPDGSGMLEYVICKLSFCARVHMISLVLGSPFLSFLPPSDAL